MRKPIIWSKIKEKREEIKRQYSSVAKIPLIYATKTQFLSDILKKCMGKILDIGAGDRFAEKFCSGIKSGIAYKSMDVDSSRYHDFYSLSDIRETFDIILLLDVIEHLSLIEGVALLGKCYTLLSPGGKIIITTPNNNHPTAFYGDCTHITPWRYHDLGGALLASGFDRLQIFRVSAKKKFRHRLSALLFSPFLKFLDIDFATGILITARKIKTS